MDPTRPSTRTILDEPQRQKTNTKNRSRFKKLYELIVCYFLSHTQRSDGYYIIILKSLQTNNAVMNICTIVHIHTRCEAGDRQFKYFPNFYVYVSFSYKYLDDRAQLGFYLLMFISKNIFSQEAHTDYIYDILIYHDFTYTCELIINILTFVYRC